MRAFEIMSEGFDLFEVEIPSSEYGYWISPEGEIFSVSYQGHYQFMQDKHNLDVRSALEKGWMRVITHSAWSDTIDVEIRNMRAAARSIAMLRRLVMSRDFENFNVEVFDAFGSNYKTFNRSGSFLNFIQQTKG
jgi:hypothetical protein